MFNLLPEQEKKEILTEYSMRRLIVTLVFFFLLGIVSLIAIFPAFVLSSSRVQEVGNSVGIVKNSPIFLEADQLNEKLNQANAKLSALRPPQKEIDVAALLRSIINHKDKNIRLTGFSYTAGKGTALGKIMVTGIANSRTDLSIFTDQLQKDPFFKKVNFPVSSFTKDQNADFQLEITGNF